MKEYIELANELIKKYEELIDWLSIRLNDLDSYTKYNELQSEIADIKEKIDNLKKLIIFING